MPLWCTNRSLPWSSGVMNPKPFSSLNHFTVPVAICSLPGGCVRRNAGGAIATTTNAGTDSAGRVPVTIDQCIGLSPGRRCSSACVVVAGPLPARDLAQRVQLVVAVGVRVLHRHLGAELDMLAHGLAKRRVARHRGRVERREV